MKKVVILIVTVILLLAMLLAISHKSNHQPGEMVKTKVWRGWQGEAAKSKYYVIQQVLAKNGITFTVRDNKAASSLVFDDYDAIILSENSTILDENFVNNLEDWVKDGGRLLFPAQHSIASRFSIAVKSIDEDSSCQEPDEKSGQFRWKTRSGVVLTPLTTLTGQINLTKKKKIRVGVACAGQLVVVMQSIAKGKVIAFAHDLSLWSDASHIAYVGMPAELSLIPIANGDNAAYLHDLLGPSKRVLLIRHPIKRQADKFSWTLPAPQWWPLLAISAMAVLAFVWLFGSRLGPILSRNQTFRADIDHHLHAAGRFWEQESGYMWLAKASQQRFASDYALLVRRFASEEAATAWLVSQTGLTAQQITDIRSNTAIPKTEFAFIKFMSILEELRRVL